MSKQKRPRESAITSALTTHLQSLSVHTQALASIHTSTPPSSSFFAVINRLVLQSAQLESQAKQLSILLAVERESHDLCGEDRKTKREPWKALSAFVHMKSKQGANTQIAGQKRKASDGSDAPPAANSADASPSTSPITEDVDSMSLSGRSLNDINISEPLDEEAGSPVKKTRRVPVERVVIEKDDIAEQVEARIKARRKRGGNMKEAGLKRRRSSGASEGRITKFPRYGGS